MCQHQYEECQCLEELRGPARQERESGHDLFAVMVGGVGVLRKL